MPAKQAKEHVQSGFPLLEAMIAIVIDPSVILSLAASTPKVHPCSEHDANWLKSAERRPEESSWRRFRGARTPIVGVDQTFERRNGIGRSE